MFPSSRVVILFEHATGCEYIYTDGLKINSRIGTAVQTEVNKNEIPPTTERILTRENYSRLEAVHKTLTIKTTHRQERTCKVH